jgi:hypothetical protein
MTPLPSCFPNSQQLPAAPSSSPLPAWRLAGKGKAWWGAELGALLGSELAELADQIKGISLPSKIV